ncbi:MAG TPA: DUF3842 family protein [Armatimonadota bacterium]|nr:DUF3842 family protein [Armatimonadota bacterium]HOM71273.1 DUF3842 family protein [Armatimonadota bacterium]
MKVVVIDGMGGGIGTQIVSRLRQVIDSPHQLIALGANATATAVMVKAGADVGATGENAMAVTVPQADVVVGPVGIIIPNSLMGEITPVMAAIIASSHAVKVLVPVQQPHVELVGMEARPLSLTLDELASRVAELLKRAAS